MESNVYIQFLFAAESEAFHGDTNIAIGEDIFVALAYPQLIVEVGSEKVLIDCQCSGFQAEPDEFPLYQFLNLFPEFAEKIVTTHPKIVAEFLEYKERSKKWEVLLRSEDNKSFLNKQIVKAISFMKNKKLE